MNRPHADLTDPSTVKARVFVANIVKTDQMQNELERCFGKYGKVLAIQLNRGFGFIQMDSEESAQAVIRNEANTILLGKKIDVKPARVGGRGPGGKLLFEDKPANNQGGSPVAPKESPSLLPTPNVGSASPADSLSKQSSVSSRDQEEPQQEFREAGRGNFPGRGSFHGRGRGGDGNMRGRGKGRGRGNKNQGPGQNQNQSGVSQGRNMEDHAPHQWRSESNDRMPFRNDSEQRDMYRERSPIHPDWDRREREMMDRRWEDSRDLEMGRPFPNEFNRNPRDIDAYRNYGPPRPEPYQPVVPLKPEKPNDCEILVLDKQLRMYGEYIEGRFRSLGMMVDVLFPRETTTIDKAVTSISERGVLFAVVINALHEENRSLSLFVLYGNPQEHRNMPLEDAMKFVCHNFTAYNDMLREKKRGNDVRIPQVTFPPNMSMPVDLASRKGKPGDEEHPENILNLLNFMVQGRPLTLMEYDRLLQYLQGKREKQVLLEPDAVKATAMSSVLPQLSPVPVFPEPEPEKTDSEKQAELQQRILKILSAGGITGAAKPGANISTVAPNPTLAAMLAKSAAVTLPLATTTVTTAPTMVPAPVLSSTWATSISSSVPQPTSSSTTTGQTTSPLLNNPTVQMALDSLIQTGPNLLKAFSGAPAGSNTTTSNSQVAPKVGLLGTAPSQPLFGAFNVPRKY